MGITITSGTDTAREEFKFLMAAARQGVTNTDLDLWFRQRMGFDAVEIYHNTEVGTSHDPEGHRHGMRFFVNGECTLHVTSALCGNASTGVVLSMELLGLLGITSDTLKYDLARAREIRFRWNRQRLRWSWEVVSETDVQNRRQADRLRKTLCSQSH